MKKRFLGLVCCALALGAAITACSGNSESAANEEKGNIVVGGKSFTEAYILSEIYSLALEDNGYTVERVYDMNTDTITPAIQSDEVDMYPEYIGTALTDILGEPSETDVDKMYEIVSTQFMDKWNIKWLDLTSMEDKVAIVMRKDRADELGVKTLSDLQKISKGLVLGDGVNFAEREDDLLRLNRIFGDFEFTVENIDSSLAYTALEDGSVDVIPGLSTDPQLLGDTFVVIEEDKPVWPPQYVAPIVRQEILDKYPEIEEICNNVSQYITTESMIEMLDKVVNNGEEYEDVAEEFYNENCK